MKTIWRFSLVCFLIVSCKGNDTISPAGQPDLRPVSATEQSVSATNAKFAFDLFKNVQQGSGGNIFISPLSVGMALGMTLNGAEGSTKDGILKTIDFGSLQVSDVNKAYHSLTGLLDSMDNKVKMDLANSVWYSQGFTVKQAFSAAIQDYYSGAVEGLDFSNASSKDIINSWVENHTDQQIKNMIGSTDGDAMLLINAIYFKGSWAYKFDNTLTRKANFQGEDGTAMSVDMMYANGFKLSIFSNNRFTFVDLPYGNGQFSMSIFLPEKTLTASALAQNLTSDSLVYWLSKADTANVALNMPKFKIGWKSSLKPELSAMGMSDAFSDNANFPDLFEGPNTGFKISDILHQSYIAVDEEGTEATAATAVVVVSLATSDPPVPKTISIDHPFLFVIREKHTGMILFIGQIYDPSSD